MWKRQNLHGSWSANVANKAKAWSFYSGETNRRQMSLSNADSLHYSQVNLSRGSSKGVSIRNNKIPCIATAISRNNEKIRNHLRETSNKELESVGFKRI